MVSLDLEEFIDLAVQPYMILLTVLFSAVTR